MVRPNRAAERPAISRPRLFLFSVVTTAVAVAAVVGLAELGARVALGDAFEPGLQMGRPAQALARFDPDLGWVLVPDLRTRVVAPTFEYVVSHNARGMRDGAVDVAKRPGTLRVAVLGDSLAWGWGVDDGETFCDLVEGELGPDVELLNFGVPGYGTDQHVWLLEGPVARYEPDLVLLCFVLNDVVGNDSAEGGGMSQRKPRYRRDASGAWVLTGHPVEPPSATAAEPRRGAGAWLRDRSALAHLVAPPDSQAALARAGAASAPDAPSAEQRLAAAGSEQLDRFRATIVRLCAQVSDPESTTGYLLERLARRCDELGVPLVAFSIPHHHDRFLYSPSFPRPEGLERHLEPGAEPFATELSRHLAAAAARLGFEAFSLDQALLAETLAGRDLNVGDGHLNAAGHRVVARRVAEELRPLLASVRSARE